MGDCGLLRQGLERYVPEHEAPLLPSAVFLPAVPTDRVGVDVELCCAEKGVFTFCLECHGDSIQFRKYVHLTLTSARSLLASLQTSIEHVEVVGFAMPHPVIGALMGKRRAAREVLRLLLRLFESPRILQDSRLHCGLGLSSNEAACIRQIAGQMYVRRSKANHIRRRAEKEARRIVQAVCRHDWELAMLASRALVARHPCHAPARLPVLVYDHDMTFRVIKPRQGPALDATGHVLGPGGIVYFVVRAIDASGACMVLDIDGKPLASVAWTSAKSLVLRRVLPMCSLHGDDSDGLADVAAAVAASGDAVTFDTTAVPGLVGNVEAMTAVAYHGWFTGLNYEITASDATGFVLYVGNWHQLRLASAKRRVEATSFQLTVYPSHDVLYVLAMSLALDLLHAHQPNCPRS
ncbi:hypothetical protein ACHHYP_07605 [Achlya hypogyna]|uniref:Uncharacterized protein n=1 Tax=Achlya hypogyna TaxID=1202772 RepID=A0A1V9ZLQ4_ACHHY|nr:hypothetical protein ACHHYP_07605 [Achlya hypogyna]